MAKKPHILAYRRQRGEQRRDEILFTIMTQLHHNNVTLKELSEYYSTKYLKRVNTNALEIRRSARRRKEVALHAVNTRWKRYYDFLEGTKSKKEKLTELGASTSNPSLPDPVVLKPAKLERELPEQDDSSSLDSFLDSFEGED